MVMLPVGLLGFMVVLAFCEALELEDLAEDLAEEIAEEATWELEGVGWTAEVCTEERTLDIGDGTAVVEAEGHDLVDLTGGT